MLGLSIKAELIYVDTVNHLFKIDLWVEVGYQVFKDGKNIYKNKSSFDEFVTVKEDDCRDHIPALVLYTADTLDVQSVCTEINFKTGEIKHYKNWLATIRDILHLQRFPLDRQLLRLPFEVTGQTEWSFTNKWYNTEPPWAKSPSVDYGIISSANPEWKMYGYRINLHENIGVINMWIERHSDFYYVNFSLVVFVIVEANGSIVVAEVTDLATRSTITLTLLLTLVAFKFVMMSNTPKISYLTYLDMNVMLGFMLLTFYCFWNSFICYLAQDLSSLDEDQEVKDLRLHKFKVLDAWVTVIGHMAWFLIHLLLFVVKNLGYDPLRESWSEVERKKVVKDTSWEKVQMFSNDIIPTGAGVVEMGEVASRPF